MGDLIKERDYTARLLDAVNNEAIRKNVRAAAREYVYNHFGSYANACATTASIWLQYSKLLTNGEIYAYTSNLATALLNRGCERIDHAKDVRAGDIIFNIDSNGNRAPDHVVIAVEKPDTKTMRVRVIDNQNNGNPYVRNLVKGYPWKLPMWYALRLPQPLPPEPIEGTPRWNALAAIGGHLRAIYADSIWLYVPEDAKALLNAFANHPFRRGVKPE